MGVDLSVWRSRIGCFVRCLNHKVKLVKSNIERTGVTLCKFNMFCKFFVICTLLVISGIETNPGPDTVELIKSEIQKSNEALIEQLTGTILASKNETIKAVTDVQVKVDKLDAKYENVKLELAKANDKITSLEARNVELTNKIDDLENKHKKNNIITFGLLETEGGNGAIDDFLMFANSKLDVTLDKSCISHAYRIGKNYGKRPLLVSFLYYESKANIMKNVAKLKGSRISIADDLSPNSRAIRKNLLIKAKEARSEGLDVKVRNNCIIIDTVTLTYNSLQKPDWLKLFINKRNRSDSQSTENKRQRDESSHEDDLSDVSSLDLNQPSTSNQGNAMPPPVIKSGGVIGSASSGKTGQKQKTRNKRGKHHHQ
jgi:hypothetical protein